MQKICNCYDEKTTRVGFKFINEKENEWSPFPQTNWVSR